jgi:hypothetical protein
MLPSVKSSVAEQSGLISARSVSSAFGRLSAMNGRTFSRISTSMSGMRGSMFELTP